MRTPSGDTDGAEDNRSKSNDLGDQDEAPTTVRVPVRLDLISTGLELIEVPIVAFGAMTVAAVELTPSARASALPHIGVTQRCCDSSMTDNPGRTDRE
jgi:hypothetical protein